MQVSDTRTVELRLNARDLVHGDLSELSTWLNPLEVSLLEKQTTNETPNSDCLVVSLHNGAVVAKGAIIYDERPGVGIIGSLVVRPELRSLGIGSFLIQASEERIRARGIDVAVLDVEESNPRARLLYERLGYEQYASEAHSWDQQAEDGTIYRYETICTLMRKGLR
ncbi:MAG: GNAT family N-acetyltransferase [Sciscionella sp.]